MTNHLEVISIKVTGDEEILVPVIHLDDAGLSADTAVATSALPDFDADDLLRPVHQLASSLRDAARRAGPTKVTMECGIVAAVKSGKLTSLLVEGEGQGSIKVTLEWDMAKD